MSNFIKRDEAKTSSFQALDSRVEYINAYDNGKYIIGISKGYYLPDTVGMYSLDELRDIYRKIRSGETAIRECNTRRVIPGRGGPIGAPAFLRGTW